MDRFPVRTPRAPSFALAAVILCAASAFAQNATPRETLRPVASIAALEVTDEAGRQVRIPQPVRRIVSLAPSMTETIFSLGAQDRLVGDTDFCDYPVEAQRKTKVGGAINPNLEQIVALRPDLVLVTKSLNRFNTVRALEQMNIPAYATDPHTVDDIISSTARLANVLGISEAGQSLARDLQRRLIDLQGKLASQPPRRVLFIVWGEPLISIGQKTFIADALRRAGAVSVVDSSQDWPQVSLEEVVRLQPEFLVFAASHSESVARNFDALAERPGWRDLEAVRNHRVAVISDAVNRPAPRMISAIEDLARQLHPGAFPENGQDKIQSSIPPQSAHWIPRADFRAPGNSSPLRETCSCSR